MGNYDDMINRERPRSARPPMPIENRAKIFMPFSALKGYEDMVKNRQKQTMEKRILSEERKEELDKRLQYLKNQLTSGENPEITVWYFIKDEDISGEEGKELGTYEVKTGKLEKIDCILRQIIVEEQKIFMEDIVDI